MSSYQDGRAVLHGLGRLAKGAYGQARRVAEFGGRQARVQAERTAPPCELIFALDQALQKGAASAFSFDDIATAQRLADARKRVREVGATLSCPLPERKRR